MTMLREDIVVFGEHDEATMQQIVRSAAEPSVMGAVLCADGHKGYAVPIGGVVAYENKISPSGVGFDIACGNKAARLDIPAREVRSKIKKIMDDIWSNLAFGVGRSNGTVVEHELFDDETWKLYPMKTMKQLARNQLGTIGSGNHYCDVFIDELERVWVGVHFGSRGLGHKTATHFLEAGGAQDGMDAEPLVLDVRSSLGGDYIACMTLAGRYAYAGRDWVCAEVARLLGAKIVEEIHNHHNFCVAGDQKIPTPSGPKRMCDIVAGDIVYAFDERLGLVPTPVLDHWHSGKKVTYKIRTRSRQLRVSGEHPVLIVRVQEKPHPERPWFDKRQGELTWTNAADVKSGDILICASEYYEQDRSIGEDLPRFIGAYLGDGWLRHNNPEVSGYSVGLAIGAREEAHTEKYADLCARVFPGATWKKNAPGAFGVTCSSKNVHQSLTDLDMAHKAGAKHLPYFAYRLPLNEKLALLAGYFDADGSVAPNDTSNHGRGTICAVSHKLVEGLREVAIACGMQVTPILSSDRMTNYGLATVYRCVISADGMRLLDLWHEGKASKQRTTQYQKSQGLKAATIGYITLPKGIFAQKVTDVEVSTDVEDVYDMSVEHGSHSFVCEGVIVHNCWKETHEGRDLWVVRKGATPAFPGQKGFVGGSMGDISVILEGVESDEGASALYSTVHGAGRVMSRTKARGKVNRKTGEVIFPGVVSKEMMFDWVRGQGVELRGAGTDESPHCYKRLPNVLEHHKASVRILHTLTPVGVAMAGENEMDPYKD